MNRNFLLASSMLALGLLATTTLANITTPAQSFNLTQGDTFSIPLRLTTTAGENVAAISGQLNFNPDLFNSPTLVLGAGASGFTAVGNTISRGKFRFVVYRNPTSFIQANNQSTAVSIRLNCSPVFALQGKTDLLFLNGPIDPSNSLKQGESSASNGLGQSLASVSFGNIHVTFNQTAVQNWLLYE